MASHWFTKEGCKCLCRQHSTQYQLHQSSSMMDAALRTEKGDMTAVSTAIMETDAAPHHDHSRLYSIQHSWSWTVTKT